MRGSDKRKEGREEEREEGRGEVLFKYSDGGFCVLMMLQMPVCVQI